MIKDVKKVLSVRKYKVGYESRELLIDGSIYGCEDFKLKVTYTPSGDLIGDNRLANFLCKKHGIKPEKRVKEHNCCSIGFSEREQKWYGWSHRACYGFKIGDVVCEGDCVTSSGWTDDYLREHPDEFVGLPVGFKAETLDDCKRMAIAFADSVS